MLSWNSFKAAGVICASLAAAGCLVSEEPLLDDSNSYAVRYHSGSYDMCPIADDPDAEDCEHYELEQVTNKEYLLIAEDESEPLGIRFHRIASRSYIIQVSGTGEEADEEILYFYGKGNSRRFLVSTMMCDELPEDLLTRLVENGDMEADLEESQDDKGIESCNVLTLDGLKEAALAYHRGDIEDPEVFEFRLKN